MDRRRWRYPVAPLRLNFAGLRLHGWRVRRLARAPERLAWSDYGGSYPSYNTYGPHNCTLYVAYRLQQNGITLSWSANASYWANEAASAGAVVNQTPTVGAVAQWNDDHVAFVDAVTARYIVITADNYQPYNVGTMPGGFTDSFEIARNSAAMPDNFVHFVAPKVQLLARLPPVYSTRFRCARRWTEGLRRA